MTPDFEIKAKGEVSEGFIQRHVLTFKNAAAFISNLAYGRNANKNKPVTVFTDNCGTCSTKHALLKQLAEENNFVELKLILGMVKMNTVNTPEIAHTLKKNNLEYIPEAHNYLKYNHAILDYTKPVFEITATPSNILEEIEITTSQITDFKVCYHKNYLAGWLHQNPQIKLSPEELWAIREQCICDLATN